VLHVITRFWAGAGGNTLLSALGADPRRYEVWVAGAEGGPLWARARQAGLGTVELRRFREVLSPADDLYVLWQLLRLLRRERFTVVHTHSAKGGFLGRLAAWLARVPLVVHTYHGFSYHDFMPARRRRAYLALERLGRPFAHAERRHLHVLANGQSSKRVPVLERAREARACTARRRPARHVHAVQLDPPGRGPVGPAEHVHERGLAGAVRPDQPDDLTAPQLERDAAQRLNARVRAEDVDGPKGAFGPSIS
jgi:hypothetical protein